MAITYRGNIKLEVSFDEIAASILAEGVWKSDIKVDVRLPNGTSAGQIDLAWGETKTGVGASATTVYDLAGSLTNREAATITFVEVTDVMVRNRSSTAVNYLTVGPDATNGFGVVASNVGFWADASDRNVIPADYNASDGDGSWVYLHSRTGVAVAAGSTDELAVITQGATSANTWDIIILGRSA